MSRGLGDVYKRQRQKSARSQKLKEVYKSVAEKLAAAGVEADGVEVDNILFELESKIVRGQIPVSYTHLTLPTKA